MDKIDTPRTNDRLEWIAKDALYKAPEQRDESLQKYLSILAADCKDFERELSASQERVRELEADAARLDYFEAEAGRGGCPALICDDDGRWAVSGDGIQNVPMGEGPHDIQTCFDVEKDQWHNSPREAIDAALKEKS